MPERLDCPQQSCPISRTAEDTGDSGRTSPIREWREIDEPDTVGEGVERFGGDGQRKPCLASPTWSGQGDESGALRSIFAETWAISASRPTSVVSCIGRLVSRRSSVCGGGKLDWSPGRSPARCVRVRADRVAGTRRDHARSLKERVIVDERSRRVGEHNLAAMRDREAGSTRLSAGTWW